MIYVLTELRKKSVGYTMLNKNKFKITYNKMININMFVNCSLNTKFLENIPYKNTHF